MKRKSLAILNSVTANFLILYRMLLGLSTCKPAGLPTQSPIYSLNINNRKKSFMENIGCLNKTILLVIAGLLFTVGSLSAQIINEGFEEADWQSASLNPGNSKTTSGSVVITATSANSTMTYYLSTLSTSSYTATVATTKGTKSSKFTSTLTSTGLNTSPNSGTWWYSKGKATTNANLQNGHSASHSWEISKSGYLITPILNAGIATVTFWAAPTDNFFMGATTDTDNPIPQNFSSNSTNNGYTLGVSTYPANGTGGNSYMQSFTYSTAVTSPFEFGVFNGGGNNILIDDISITINQGTQATVTTGNYASLTETTVAVSGTITANTPSPSAIVTSSGVCYSSTAAIPDTSGTYTIDGPAGVSSGSITSTITNLIPNTLYYARAYAITTAGVVYGSTISFTTLAATAPILTTVPASNILSTKATSGGNISDSGGVAIIQEGVCWSTTSGNETATAGTSFTSDGTAGTTFSSLLKSLQPSTTYYVKAYAVNSVGLSYASNEISFTTEIAGPIITASADTITFPTVTANSNPKVLSDTIFATNLTPKDSVINVAAPAGYLISTSSSGGFTDSLSIPYSNGTLSKTVIYISQITTSYSQNIGNITFSIGGVVNPNFDQIVLIDNIIPDPNVLTNLGTDFWVGHGLEENMVNKGKYGLQVYIATGVQQAVAKVSIPGIPSFAPQYFTIPPNTVQIVSGFPTGDGTATNKSKAADARLYYTGLSNRAIHVEVTNNVPVAVFLYDYATNNSAGGSMVFPTNTWNSSYIVQTYGGASSNQNPPNTYFFVMAKEDNTKVYFTPTASIIDSASSPIVSGNIGGTIAYAAGVKDSVILNKGQVFNAIGMVDPGGIIKNKKDNGISEDLTGTTVSSDCAHPISVFAGNSRTLINTHNIGCTPDKGSDNLIQQMFPKVAWGTKYLTVPTKTMEYNLFRINVQDTNTIVTVDGSVLDKTLPTTYWYPNGLYYEIEGNTCREITSNIPITVTQFILPGKTCVGADSGNNGTGDPEMILLSPVQQSIKTTTVYAPNFQDKNSGGAYINVVIPTSGVSSFRLDSALNPAQYVDTGSSSYPDTLGASYPYYPADTLIPIAQAFKPFPQDSAYSWAKFHVNYYNQGAINTYDSLNFTGIHTMSASVGFNAIAYGVADGESWGYNAGTTINDLTDVITTKTPYGSAPSATTCKGNTTWINISVPFDTLKISSIEWKSANDPSIIPSNYDTSVNKPVTVGHFVQNGITFYTFQSPIAYTFDSLGTFNFAVTVYGSFSNDCGGSKTYNVPMTIGKDITNFTYSPISCGSATYQFKNITQTFSSASDSLMRWTFPDNLFDSNGTRRDTAFKFTLVAANNPANETVKLRSINTIGCYSDTVKTFSVLIAPPPVAAFGLKDSICSAPGTDTFTNNTDINYSTTYGKPLTYLWNFGDGGATSTTANPVHQYTNSGNYNTTLIATSAANCSDTAKHTLVVETPPVPSVISPASPVTTYVGELPVTVTDNVNNGTWVNTEARIASMDANGNTASLKGLTKGKDTIFYIVPAKVCNADTASFILDVELIDVYIPNLFTPDASNNNIFYIRGNSALYKDAELWVFSSWGNQVFHSKGGVDDINTGWNGTYGGKPQPSGVYVYVAKTTKQDGTPILKKGSITLIR